MVGGTRSSVVLLALLLSIQLLESLAFVPKTRTSVDGEPLGIRMQDELAVLDPPNLTNVYHTDLCLTLATHTKFSTIYSWEPFTVVFGITDQNNKTQTLASVFPFAEQTLGIDLAPVISGPVTISLNVTRTVDKLQQLIVLHYNYLPQAPLPSGCLLAGDRFGGNTGSSVGAATVGDLTFMDLLSASAVGAHTSASDRSIAESTLSSLPGRRVREAAIAAHAATTERARSLASSPVVLTLAACNALPAGCGLPELVSLLKMFRAGQVAAQHEALRLKYGGLPRPLPTIRNRLNIAETVQAEGLTVGLEVGTQTGRFAASILSVWTKCELFFVVDPWEAQDSYFDTAKDFDQDDNLMITYRRLSPKGKVVMVQDFSVHASLSFPDASLDFVYIDARHDYGSVLEDMQAWWPKIREGGILAGHDFHDVPGAALWQAHLAGTDTIINGERVHGWAVQADGSVQTEGKAVRSAVLEFAEAHHRQVSVTTSGELFPSWYMRR